MTMKSPSIILFISIILVASPAILLARDWIVVWIWLELSLWALMPLIARYSEHGTLKYFLFQTLGSTLFFLSIILFTRAPIFRYLILGRLLLKLGAAPFHFWVPQIYKLLPFFLILILATISKLPRLIVMWAVTWSAWLLFIVVSARVVVGRVGGIFQHSLRNLLAYSSISHVGWIICIPLSIIAIYYFIIYIALMRFLVVYSIANNIPNICIFLLAIGGLPPLAGFFPKLCVLLRLLNWSKSLSLVLAMTSVLSLFYYLILFVNAIILAHPTSRAYIHLGLLRILSISILTL